MPVLPSCSLLTWPQIQRLFFLTDPLLLSLFPSATEINLCFFFKGTRFSRVQHLIGPNLFSSSGQQLFCLDDYSGGRCLLDVMADPSERNNRALALFTFGTAEDLTPLPRYICRWDCLTQLQGS